MITCVAYIFGSKSDFILSDTSTRDRPRSWTMGRILNGHWIFSVMRYCISSKTPSGGMNVIVRSLSYFANRTHWWNLQSSIMIPPSLLILPWCVQPDATIALSFIPNLHSGIPLSKDLTMIWPLTSYLSKVPLLESKTFTDSITSCILRSCGTWYLHYLQLQLPVYWIVIFCRCSILFKSILLLVVALRDVLL